MPQPLSDYFALEAGEFLDALDHLLSRTDSPDPREFFRLARGVRGSAQIAGATGIAGVAERLEDGARALREGRLQWSEELKQRSIRTVDDVRVLVRAHGRWGEAEEARAKEAAARWGGEGDRRTLGASGGGDQLFAFVRREITGVVAEMDRVAAELRDDPGGREPLRSVLRRMRPVRGVAGMATLAPILEVLEGIEDAVHEVLSRALAVEGRYMDLLAAARDALAEAGTSLERGEAPAASAPELDRFRDLRDQGEAADDEAGPDDVVPISRLFSDEGGPHVVASPMAPVAIAEDGATPVEVEAFIRIEATGFLDRADALIAEQGARANRFARIAGQLAGLASSVGELARTYAVEGIAAAADDAETRLRAAATADEARDVLDDLRAALPGAAPRAPRIVAPPAPPAPEPSPAAAAATVASETAASSADGGGPAPAADGVVPIESLLYAPGDALREALELRPRIDALAAAAKGTPLADTLDELFALVELGLKRAS
jgi:chemotaxis protein histidine kinase CheA